METNKNINKRDKYLFDDGRVTIPEWSYSKDLSNYDIMHYEGMDVETLKTLIENNWADPEERQNEAPTIEEFQDFLDNCPSFRAHGYVVAGSRGDCRVSIEGVMAIKEPEPYEASLYVDLFRQADEFDSEFPYRCWFD